MVDKIYYVVLSLRRLQLKMIVEISDNSEKCVGHILYKIFSMKKLSSRRVPRLFTPKQERNGMTASDDCLARIQRNLKAFFMRFVTVEKTSTRNQETVEPVDVFEQIGALGKVFIP